MGVDAGGSHTRVICAGLDGRVLGAGRAAGGSPTHNADAQDHVRSALHGGGVRLLAGHFASDTVPVALHGGLALSPAFAGRMATELEDSWRKRFEIRDAVLTPVAGAALLALQRAGLPTNAPVIEQLARFDQSTDGRIHRPRPAVPETIR